MNFHSSRFNLSYLALNYCSTFLTGKKLHNVKLQLKCHLHKKSSLYQMQRIPSSVLTQYFSYYILIFTVEEFSVPFPRYEMKFLQEGHGTVLKPPNTFRKHIRYNILFTSIYITQPVSLHTPCVFIPYLFYELDMTIPMFQLKRLQFKSIVSRSS